MLQPLQDPLRRFADQAVAEPSYIVFREAGVVYAKNCRTGQIEFSGTDAATVIQSAIDALPIGNRILLKSGDYLLSSPIDLTGKLSITIEGEAEPGHPTTGRGARLCLKDGVNDHVIKKVEAERGYYCVALRNLNICGNKANNPFGKSLIYMKNVDNILIENNKLGLSRASAIELVNVRFVRIMNNEIGTEGAANDGHGIFVDGMSAGFIAFNTMLENDTGIYIKSDAALTEDIIIVNNHIVRNRGYGILVERGANLLFLLKVIGNNINENGKDGICFLGRVGYTIIALNHIIDNGYPVAAAHDGIRLDGPNACIICLNKISGLSGVQRYAITLKDLDWVFIWHNDVGGNAVGAINFEGTVLHAFIRWNPGYFTENSGTATFSGDGVTRSFLGPPHFLSVTDPHRVVVHVSPVSADARAASPVAGAVDPVDNTRIRFYFATAPPAGTNNVTVVWKAEADVDRVY